MGAQENKQTAIDAYAAFSAGDAEGAMSNIDESIEWTVRGDNSLTGVHKGKPAVGELWGALMTNGFSSQTNEFIADGNKVVVLATVTMDGESVENADILTYNDGGKLVAFDSLGDEALANRLFAR